MPRVNSIVNLLAPDFTTCVLYPGDEVPAWASVGDHLIAPDEPVEVEPVEVVDESPEPVKPKRGRPAKKKTEPAAAEPGDKDPFDMSRDELLALAKQRNVTVPDSLTDSELAALLQD